MSAYYNEFDPYAAQWLRNLIAGGHIAPGDVDERSLLEVQADDLKGYTQVHCFAGIGIWSHALRRAGWPDDRPIWTGSCPCQPFSAAGQQKGFDDARHLWPVWFRLIAQCAPPVVLGEQVASKDGLQWLDLVSSDLEGAGYAFGASDLCAAGFQQAHLRQRLYFVGLAHHHHQGLQGQHRVPECAAECLAGAAGMDGRVADTVPTGRPERRPLAGCGPAASSSSISRLAQPYGGQRDGLATGEGRQPNGQEAGRLEGDGGAPSGSATGGVDHATGPRYLGPVAEPESDPRDETRLRLLGERREVGADRSICDKGQIAERWLDVDWLLCRNPAGEPSWRPVEPGTFPLHHGHSNRMGKLRAYGNALDAETATGFVSAVMEAAALLADVESLL